MTPAVRALKKAGISFSTHLYAHEERGGTATSARELELPEHAIIKTLILEDDQRRPLIVLMHGDQEVSTKNLARLLSVKSITPCAAEIANRHSGYQVGGTSPFATRKTMPVYMEKSILDLPKIYINGGKRGFLVGLAPEQIIDHLQPELVNVGI